MNRIGVALLTALLVGCETHVYQLQLEPKSTGLERTLTVWREKQGQKENIKFAQDELDRLGKLYSEHPSAAEDIRQVFRGTFAEKLPQDVGGYGTYRTATSPLGSAHWYMERFRGTTDPDGELYDRRAAVDRFVDLVVGWFDEQLKDAAHREQVHRFLNQDFRQDVRNVAFYVFLAASDDRPEAVRVENSSEPQRLPDHLAAAVQYLTERGYGDSVATLSVELSRISAEQDQLRGVRKLLARKSGLDAAQADALFPFLEDLETARKSWNDYLRKTPEFERKRKAWKFDPEKPQEADGPAPEAIVDDLTAQAVTFEVFEDRDELRLTLVVPRVPHESNGDFEPAGPNEPGGAVSWHRHLHGRRELPTVCYAAWTVPNDQFQAAHFDKTALDGEALAKFAGYFSALPTPLQAEFTAHLQSLEPGDALRGRVRDFRFTSPADDDAKHLVGRMLDLLYENL